MSNGAGKFSPFPKMSFRTSLHDKVLPKTVCFVTVHWCQSWGLNSDREAQSAWCPQPRHWGLCPPGSAAYVTLSVQHPHTLRAHELKFHVATKHEQRTTTPWFSRLPCVRIAKCRRGKHYARSRRHLLMRRRRLRASRRPI